MALFFCVGIALLLTVGLLWNIEAKLQLVFSRGSLLVRVRGRVFFRLITVCYERRFLLSGEQPVRRILREYKFTNRLMTRVAQEQGGRPPGGKSMGFRFPANAVSFTRLSAEGAIGLENDAVATLFTAGILQMALETACAAAKLPLPDVQIQPLFDTKAFRINVEGIVVVHTRQIILALLPGIFCEKRGKQHVPSH